MFLSTPSSPQLHVSSFSSSDSPLASGGLRCLGAEELCKRMGLCRHPWLDHPLVNVILALNPALLPKSSKLWWKARWLKVATCHLTLRTTVPLGNLIDVWRVPLFWGFQAGSQHPWNQSWKPSWKSTGTSPPPPPPRCGQAPALRVAKPCILGFFHGSCGAYLRWSEASQGRDSD